MCDNKEQLVSYLYDELDGADRQMFEAHVAACGECRDELAGLRSTRREMAAWAPPEPDFGFRIVRGASAPPVAPRARFSPAWGLAAAAVLVLATAAAIANVDVRYGADGLVVRTGWGSPASVPPAQTAAGVARSGETPVDWKTELGLLDRRLRGLESAAAAQPQNAAVQVASGPRMSDAEIWRRVRELLAQSETRQQRELADSITALAREVDNQRRVDLALVQQGLRGASNADAARYNQSMNSLLRLVTQQQK